MTPEPAWPWTESFVAAMLAMFCVYLLIAVMGCSGANTGSRRTGLPLNAFRVRGVTVIPFPDAQLHEIDYLRETVEEHLIVLDKHAVPIVPIYLRFYRTRLLLNAAHVAAPPGTVIWSPALTGAFFFSGTRGRAFLSGVTLNVTAGTKLEGPNLAHFQAHVAWGLAALNHADLRWTHGPPTLDFDDWLASSLLYARR